MAGIKRSQSEKEAENKFKKIKLSSERKAKPIPQEEPSDSSSDGPDWDEEEVAEEPEGEAEEQAEQTNGSKSRESHAAQKALQRERKLAKPNADSIQRTKKIWERLRLKSHVPPEERKKLVAELFEILNGRVKEFVFKHDAVRVIQTALKYGNLEQRTAIAKELKGTYKKLAESKYAKYLISKLLVHGNDEIKAIIVPEFYGQVRRLMKHAEASQVLDDIYRGFSTPEQRALFLSEWYGPEFALFGVDKASELGLDTILANNPEKRSTIMKSIFELVKTLVEKNMHGLVMLHDAMLEYFRHAKRESTEVTEFIELLKSDEDGNLLRNLVYTKAGARVVCLGLAHGTAKDRKFILKAFKGYVRAIALDDFGHSVIVASYETVDDTVLLSKSIIAELVDDASDKMGVPFADLSVHINGRIPLLYLHAGKAKWLFSEDELSLLSEVETVREVTSKKEPALRRAELLPHIAPSLLALIAEDPRLVISSFGCQLIGAVLLEPTLRDQKDAALQTVAELAAGDPTEAEHIAQLPYAGRMLKGLVADGHYDPEAKAVTAPANLGFANLLYDQIQPHLVQWACGPSSFTVLAMLESQNLSKDRAEGLRKTLKSSKKLLQEAAKAKETTTPAEENGKKRPKRVSGNKGSELLLQKIT